MYFGYVSNAGGFAALISTSFGLWLTVKMTLALGLLSIFAGSPFLFMQSRSRSIGGHLRHFFIVTGGPEDFRIDRFEFIHYLALGLGLAVVVIAKIMFFI